MSHSGSAPLQGSPVRLHTSRIMLEVSLAMVPGLVVMATEFGARVFLHVATALVAALVAEVSCLRLRRQSAAALRDGSAVVTALLIAAAVPPAASPGITALAAAIAIGLGKQVFGGLGRNLFNPAMVGYAMVLVSFPASFALWSTTPDSAVNTSIDATTGATLLDVLKHDHGHTLSELASHPAFGHFGAAGFEDAGIAFLAGGLFLAWRRHIAWRVPASLLLTVGLITVFLWDGGGSDSSGTPMQQWFAGGLMLAAFFIATDPVTHPRSRRGQWLFGGIAGTVIMLIRAEGSFPDGIAFAILFANSCTPWLERRLAG